MKRYVLRGVGEVAGLRDIFPSKRKITKWNDQKLIVQGTCKVICLSLQFVAAWIKHMKVELPPMTGEKWVEDEGT